MKKKKKNEKMKMVSQEEGNSLLIGQSK